MSRGTDPRLEDYAFSHDRCAVCHARKYAVGSRLELHHIVGRRGGDRCHDARNLILICGRDHMGYHSGGKRSLTLGQVLTAKRDEDGEVDVDFLASLLRRKALRDDPMPLPQWALEERVDNAPR
jgi:hypothetical protein